VRRSSWFTHDGEIAPAAIASASRGCRARMRTCATAPFASPAFSRVIAARQAEEVPYPEARASNWNSPILAHPLESLWMTFFMAELVDPRDAVPGNGGHGHILTRQRLQQELDIGEGALPGA
jgi:hypothetical protein